MKKAKYHDMLKDEIREFMSMSRCRTLEHIIARAREREIDLETMKKMKSVQEHVSEGLGKKPKVFDSRSRGQQGRGCCDKFGKAHDEVCRVGGSGCYRCGKTSHFSKDCPTIQVYDLICFDNNNRGHKKASCPSVARGAMSVPAPTMLRITDELHGKADAVVGYRSYLLRSTRDSVML